MKKIVFLLMLTTLSGTAQKAQNFFQQGNTYYQQGNYNQALQSYQYVLQSQQHSPELYYNLGNTCYKLGQVAPAIYYYHKALLLKPNDPQILNNLSFAQKLTIDDIKATPKVGFAKLTQTFTSVLSYNGWATAAVTSAILILVAFTLYYFTQSSKGKQLFFVLMLLAILATLLSVLSGYITRQAYIQDKPAIVFAEQAPVKTQPQAQAPDAYTLHEGTQVQVLETQNSWVKVQLPDETIGWMQASHIKQIK